MKQQTNYAIVLFHHTIAFFDRKRTERRGAEHTNR